MHHPPFHYVFLWGGLEEYICGSLLRLPRSDKIYNLKMKAVSSTETMENFYQTKWYHIPEDCNRRSYNFKSQM
jgi:hypothetical protein